MDIVFGNNESFVSTSLPTLKPWDIYEVKFEECVYEVIQGKKDPSMTYPVLKFKFKGDKGQFTETLFAPKSGDEVRGTKKNKNGHEIPTPSILDNFIYELGHLLTFICPEALKAITGKKVESFEKLAQFIVKSTAKSKNKTVFIKLIGNKDNKARFPYFLNIFESNPNQPVITNNFISDNADKLAFTDYELQQKAKIESAKPTDMASVANTDLNEVSDDSNDDLANLDLDI